MLNFIEVFDIMHVEPATGASVWTGLTGTRTALKRDGHTVDPKAMAARSNGSTSAAISISNARAGIRAGSRIRILRGRRSLSILR